MLPSWWCRRRRRCGFWLSPHAAVPCCDLVDPRGCQSVKGVTVRDVLAWRQSHGVPSSAAKFQPVNANVSDAAVGAGECLRYPHACICSRQLLSFDGILWRLQANVYDALVAMGQQETTGAMVVDGACSHGCVVVDHACSTLLFRTLVL